MRCHDPDAFDEVSQQSLSAFSITAHVLSALRRY